MISEGTLRDNAKHSGFSWAKVLIVLNEIGALRVLVERDPDVWGYQLP